MGAPPQEQREELSFLAVAWFREPKAFPSLVLNKLDRIPTLI